MQGVDDAQVVISKVVLEYLIRPKAKESAQVVKEVQNIQRAKKNVLADPASRAATSTGNPSTKLGAGVTEEFLAQIRQNNLNREQKKVEAEQKKIDKKRKSDEKAVACAAAWNAVVGELQTFDGTEQELEAFLTNKRFKVADLKLVAGYFHDKTGGKKADLARTLAARLYTNRNPPPDVSATVLTDDEEEEEEIEDEMLDGE